MSTLGECEFKEDFGQSHDANSCFYPWAGHLIGSLCLVQLREERGNYKYLNISVSPGLDCRRLRTSQLQEVNFATQLPRSPR